MSANRHVDSYTQMNTPPPPPTYHLVRILPFGSRFAPFSSLSATRELDNTFFVVLSKIEILQADLHVHPHTCVQKMHTHTHTEVPVDMPSFVFLSVRTKKPWKDRCQREGRACRGKPDSLQAFMGWWWFIYVCLATLQNWSNTPCATVMLDLTPSVWLQGHKYRQCRRTGAHGTHRHLL